MEKKAVISESTLVPVSFLIILFGFCAWLTTVWANGQENTKQILEMKETRKDDMEFIRQELKDINSKLDKR